LVALQHQHLHPVFKGIFLDSPLQGERKSGGGKEEKEDQDHGWIGFVFPLQIHFESPDFQNFREL
jgi:hypothetical protein